jgi:hypothetical protein
MSEYTVYDLTQEILNHKEDSRSIVGNKFVASCFGKERGTVECKNPQESVGLLNSRVVSASAFDQGQGIGMSTLQKTGNRFARNDGAFHSPSAFAYGESEKLPSFSSQFKFAQSIRLDAPSIQPYSSSLSNLVGIAPHNFVQPVHISQSHHSKYSYSAGKFTAVSRKMAPASLGHLCESCFRPRGDHSKTCPQFIREQEEKEMRRTRVFDDIFDRHI